jgi:signal transduction histidine kinase
MIDSNRPEWLAVLAHEMRTPLASIIGYGELMEDGLFGEIDPRALDALKRVRFAALNLNTLIDGIDRLGDVQHIGEDRSRASLRDILLESFELLRLDAEGRGVTIVFGSGDTSVSTVRDDAIRGITLALSAAIKASPNRELRVDIEDSAIVITNTRLTDEDDVNNLGETRISGPGLRLTLARQALRFVGATITMEPCPLDCRLLRLAFPEA